MTLKSESNVAFEADVGSLDRSEDESEESISQVGAGEEAQEANESSEDVKDVSSDDDDDDDDVVEVKGTKFNLKELSEDMEVEGSSDEADDEDGDETVETDGGFLEEGGSDDEGKSGWADAMAKVLSIGKESDNKNLLLSKAKKDREIKAMDTKTKEGKDNVERAAIRLARKKEVEAKGRSKPDPVMDRYNEKNLSRIATRGVVQLFNAVREQQKDIKNQLSVAGHSTRKREKVYSSIDKEGFLQVLQGGKQKDQSETLANTAKRPKVAIGKEAEEGIKTEVKQEDEAEEEQGWSVLRDDFMMGAKMKDWDKESESEDCGVD